VDSSKVNRTDADHDDLDRQLCFVVSSCRGRRRVPPGDGAARGEADLPGHTVQDRGKYTLDDAAGKLVGRPGIQWQCSGGGGRRAAEVPDVLSISVSAVGRRGPHHSS